jgi:hypothetical protein
MGEGEKWAYRTMSRTTSLHPALWPRGAFIPGALFSPVAEPRPG